MIDKIKEFFKKFKFHKTKKKAGEDKEFIALLLGYCVEAKKGICNYEMKNYGIIRIEIDASKVLSKPFLYLLYTIMKQDNDILIICNEPYDRSYLEKLKKIGVEFFIQECKDMNYLVVDIYNFDQFLFLFDYYGFEFWHIYSYKREKSNKNEVFSLVYKEISLYAVANEFDSLFEDPLYDKIELAADVYSKYPKVSIAGKITNLIYIYNKIMVSILNKQELNT